MTNITSTTTPPPLTVGSNEPHPDLVKYYLYITEGFIIAFLNALIVLTILKHERLRERKEYWVVGGLALADVLHSLGFLTAGFYRIWLILKKRDTEQVSSWDCMKTTHNLLFIFASPLSALMLTCCSLDRLIAMRDPLVYFSIKRWYAFLLVGFFYSSAGAVGLGAIYLSYHEPRVAEHQAVCFTTWAIGVKWYQKFFWFVQFLGGLFSVILYVFVWLVYRKKRNQIIAKSHQTAMSEQEKKNQRRLMITLGFSTMFTLIFFVTPNLMQFSFVETLTPAIFANVITYQGIVVNLNALVNIFLYTFRHKDIREGLFCLFTCQELTSL